MSLTLFRVVSIQTILLRGDTPFGTRMLRRRLRCASLETTHDTTLVFTQNGDCERHDRGSQRNAEESPRKTRYSLRQAVF